MSATSDDPGPVLEANEAFYRAFAARDPGAMEALWSRRHPVSCIHPGWDMVIGLEAVMATWRRILADPGAPHISCRDAVPVDLGAHALVLCHEILEQGVLVATNVFAREGAAWKMIHHQAGPTGLVAARPATPPSPRLH